MMHAKTAVADGMWARVGSTNLNTASWIGNYELDVAIEDQDFAQSMEDMFLEDLENSTEVVLARRNKVALVDRRPRRPRHGQHVPAGSLSRAGAGTIRVGYTIGAALTEHRLLGHAEARITGIAGLLLLIIALTALFWPLSLTIPTSLLCGWMALSLLLRTVKLYRRGSHQKGPTRKEE